MVSNVYLNASAQVQNISKQPDDRQKIEQVKLAAEAADRIEISAEAKSAVSTSGRSPASQYFMEVFSVNFWSRGVSEAYEMALEALRASIVADNDTLKYFESLVGETLTEDYAKANFLIQDFEPGTNGEALPTVDITVED